MILRLKGGGPEGATPARDRLHDIAVHESGIALHPALCVFAGRRSVDHGRTGKPQIPQLLTSLVRVRHPLGQSVSSPVQVVPVPVDVSPVEVFVPPVPQVDDVSPPAPVADEVEVPLGPLPLPLVLSEPQAEIESVAPRSSTIVTQQRRLGRRRGGARWPRGGWLHGESTSAQPVRAFPRIDERSAGSVPS